jgi:hypothetical protein
MSRRGRACRPARWCRPAGSVVPGRPGAAPGRIPLGSLVVRYTSPEWIEAAGRALAGDPRLKEATIDLGFVLEQVVTRTPTGTVTWHVTIDHGTVTMTAGPAPAPDVRFTTSYGIAAQIAAGKLGAQRAFAEGDLRVGGDLSLLVAHQRTLAGVDDALAAVRAETTY